MGYVSYIALIIGNSGSGKTLLQGAITNEPHPQIEEVIQTTVKIPGLDDNKKLFLYDPGVDSNGEVARPYFLQCDLSIVVFAIDDPVSLQNVETQWMVQVRRRVPSKPVMLIGNKLDLRSDPETIARVARMGRRTVTYEEGCDMARKIGACIYIECSAKHNINIQEVTQNMLQTLENYDVDKEVKGDKDKDKCFCRIS